ncbi:sensor histidine kinase [Actinomadura miaoliensis]|uniref:histidine kinase n=1 Tax=Actinomadura miaoliensis TaxID=430685 RepID=A0ABP7W0L5_9ACTN
MDVPPPPPLLKRLPPGFWTALAWCAGLAYTGVASLRLPGEVPDPFPHGFLHLDAGHWRLMLAGTVATAAGSVLLRRAPLPSMLFLLAGSVFAGMALNSTEIAFPQFLAVDVALCVVAATLPARVSLGAAAMALAAPAGYATVRVLLGFPIGTATLLAVALTAVVAWLVGNSLRQSRDHARTLHAQAVTAERLRIARELHDMVAHSIGIIAIQAGAASMVIDTRPAQARDALRSVELASRETLSGLRRMLGALRQAEPAVAPGLVPASGLADLDRLAAATAAAGVRVDLRRLGERTDLPAEIDLSAFRIVQESLTNVVRHAGTDSCQVTIDHRDGELAIEIVDSGRGPHHRAPGYGLIGMRERVALLDGDLTAGPRPEGGFRVAARLPLPERVR